MTGEGQGLGHRQGERSHPLVDVDPAAKEEAAREGARGGPPGARRLVQRHQHGDQPPPHARHQHVPAVQREPRDHMTRIPGRTRPCRLVNLATSDSTLWAKTPSAIYKSLSSAVYSQPIPGKIETLSWPSTLALHPDRVPTLEHHADRDIVAMTLCWTPHLLGRMLCGSSARDGSTAVLMTAYTGSGSFS